MEKKNKKLILIILGPILIMVLYMLYFLGFRVVHVNNIHANWDAVSSIATIVGVVVSTFAVIIAVLVPKKIFDNQKKLDLLDRRLDIYNNIREYVFKIDKWEFDYGWFLKLRLSQSQITAYFDSKVVDFYNMLDEKSKYIDKLHGDYDAADKKGNCNGKTAEEIEKEIDSIVNKVQEDFRKIENYIVDNYLTIK